MGQTIEFSIQQGDITSFDADVVALKYAQAFYGTDKIVAFLLNRVGVAEQMLRPHIGEYVYVKTQNCIQARYALFVGVPDLRTFDYKHSEVLSRLKAGSFYSHC